MAQASDDAYRAGGVEPAGEIAVSIAEPALQKLQIMSVDPVNSALLLSDGTVLQLGWNMAQDQVVEVFRHRSLACFRATNGGQLDWPAKPRKGEPSRHLIPGDPSKWVEVRQDASGYAVISRKLALQGVSTGNTASLAEPLIATPSKVSAAGVSIRAPGGNIRSLMVVKGRSAARFSYARYSFSDQSQVLKPAR